MKNKAIPGCCSGSFLYNMGTAHDFMYKDVKHYPNKEAFQKDLEKNMFATKGEAWAREYKVCILSKYEQPSECDWLRELGWTESKLDGALSVFHTVSYDYMNKLPKEHSEKISKDLEKKGIYI